MRRLTAVITSVVWFCLALFATNALAAPPVVVKTGFSHISTDSARFEALVDPKGAPTKYRFEYGIAPCSSSTCTRAPVPEGKVPAVVSATGDLKAGNETITNVSVSSGAFAIGDVISGVGIPVDPDDPTTIIGIDAAAKTLKISEQITATATGVALTATGPQPVSVTVGGLSPNTLYHLRIIANNGEKADGTEVTFITYRLPQVFPSCPNDAFRIEQPSGALPDCRAYEQASPVGKNGMDALGQEAYARVSSDGNAVVFVTTSSVPGGEGGQELPVYLAGRGAGNWSTQGLLPPESAGTDANVLGWTPDFANVFDLATKPVGSGFDSTFLSRESATRGLTPVVPYGSNLAGGVSFAGTSADGSKVFFENQSQLAQAPAGLEGKPNVYVWDRATNTLRLASALNSAGPEGQAPTKGAFAGAYDWIGEGTLKGGSARSYYTQDNGAITAAGDLYFTAAASGRLYLRRNPTKAQSPLDVDGECTDPALACTVQVSASQKENGGEPDGTDAGGERPAAFMGAASDGSRVLLASAEKLTNDATTGPEPGPATIAGATLGASEAEGIDTDLIPAQATGLVTQGEFLYWANPTQGTIGRSKLDGTLANKEFISDLGSPRWLAADSKYLYWTDMHEGNDGEGTIGRVELDGSSDLKPEFITGANRPQGIAVSATNIYWANEGTSAKGTRSIGRAGIAGDGVQQDWRSLTANEIPRGIAVDDSHIYWTLNRPTVGETVVVELIRIDLDGTNEKFAAFDEGPNLKLGGIALDASHVYWADQSGGRIGRSDLNLGSLDPDFISATETGGSPIGLALAGPGIFWSLNGEPPTTTGNDLYRYETATGELTDLTVDTTDLNGAEVKGVLGTSEDGSHVYFAANGVPDGTVGSPNANGEEAEAGSCKGKVDAGLSYSGTCNLYLAREGQPTQFISQLDASSDASNWVPRGNLISGEKAARVSPDGQTLLFRSERQLSAYENEGVSELYLYRVGGAEISCVSCDPSGEGPSGRPGFGSVNLTGPVVPPNPASTLTRNLSADGKRVFFETTDSLVGQDTNGEDGCPQVGSPKIKFPTCLDVYEWEAQGTGSCKEDEQGGGCIYLLSSGKSPNPSFIVDASASGDDVFLITRTAGFVTQDQDQLYDVFDVRVGGGLSAQNPPPAEICTTPEDCREGATPPPAFESPQTPRFSGPGNVKEKGKGSCPKAKAKKGKGKAKKNCKGKKHGKGKRKAGKSERASR